MSSNISLIIKPLEAKDISQVARIHMDAFRDSALTRLGLEPVITYYQYLLSYQAGNSNNGCFDQDNRLLGFSFSGKFGGSLSGFLNKHKKYLIRWVLYHPWKILNPLIINRVKMALSIFNRSYRGQTTNQSPQIKSFGILSIAVDPEKQGFGIGRLLIDNIEREALSQNFHQIHLTVHPDNSTAVSFYEKCGFIKIDSAQENWTGFMSKALKVRD